MIDVQGFAAVGGVFLAMMTLFGGLYLWLLRDMKQDIRELRADVKQDIRELSDRMDRIHSDLLDRMDRNHREMLNLLHGHTHTPEGQAVVFRLQHEE